MNYDKQRGLFISLDDLRNWEMINDIIYGGVEIARREDDNGLFQAGSLQI
jgi:hypothetical protein